MKKFLALLLALCLCLSIFPTTALAVEAEDFVIDEKGVLTEYNGPGGDVVIPEGVTSIGNEAFEYCFNLTSVTIPDSVTTIGDYAFRGCTGLTSVTIGNGVTKIGYQAFRDCTGLTSVAIPDSVTEIGNVAFSGCTSLTSVALPSSLTVHSNVFPSDTKITLVGHYFDIQDGVLKGYRGPGGNVVIPNSVTQIGDRTFEGCTSLTSITIPNSVTKIGAYAFRGCTGLTSITIPSSVTTIGGSAFSGCTGLTSVTIPNSVTKIGNSAFSGCTALASATVPNATNIGDFAFPSTTKITRVGEYFDIQNGVLKGYRGPGGDVVIPDGVTSIQCGYYNDSLEYSPFIENSKLTSVTIPEGVTSIGDYTFVGCTKLTSVTIPKSVTTIGYRAFYDCTSLTSVTIPNSVTMIGEYAFDGCRSLTSVTIPNSVTKIGEGAFFNCTGLTSITIPGGVMRVSIRGCANLSNVTVLPGVKEISLSLSNLRSISLPDSVEKLSISSNALRELVIPSGVTQWPGLDCPRLSKLTFPKDNWVFKGISRATFMDKIKNYPSLNEIVNCPNEFVPDLIAANKTLRDNWTDPKSTIVAQSARITKLSNEITAGLTTQYDKAKAISQWVVDHIKYDKDYYYEGLKDYSDVPFDPEGILDKGQAVCAGFARLTQALLVAQGIPCLYVLGWVSEGYHAWNLAYIDGEYLWIDNTWGMKYFGLGIYAISRDHTATGAASFNNVKGPGTLVQGSSEADGMTETAEETTADNTPVLPAATGMAYASTQEVEVDGKKVEFQYYALKDENGDPTNYIKLRDLAFALNGTPAQFQVAWDGAEKSITLTSGTAYTPDGSENSTPYSGNQIYAVSAAKLIINGKAMNLAAFTLDNGGYTYFQLRELGQNLGFNVGWSRARGVFVETDKPYDPND